MTATNHSLTGAAIALLVKRPELAIPLAFASHFLADLIPHYNPPGVNRETFISHADSWQRKMRFHSFRVIFTLDMLLAFISVITVPFIVISSVSVWTVFFSMVAAASPDFLGGLAYTKVLLTHKKSKASRFDRFHVQLQWRERPWGIYVEIVWAVFMLFLLKLLSQ